MDGHGVGRMVWAQWCGRNVAATVGSEVFHGRLVRGLQCYQGVHAASAWFPRGCAGLHRSKWCRFRANGLEMTAQVTAWLVRDRLGTSVPSWGCFFSAVSWGTSSDEEQLDIDGGACSSHARGAPSPRESNGERTYVVMSSLASGNGAEFSMGSEASASEVFAMMMSGWPPRPAFIALCMAVIGFDSQ